MPWCKDQQFSVLQDRILPPLKELPHCGRGDGGGPDDASVNAVAVVAEVDRQDAVGIVHKIAAGPVYWATVIVDWGFPFHHFCYYFYFVDEGSHARKQKNGRSIVPGNVEGSDVDVGCSMAWELLDLVLRRTHYSYRNLARKPEPLQWLRHLPASEILAGYYFLPGQEEKLVAWLE